MADNSYHELKTITDDFYAGKRNKYGREVVGLLERYGIKIRNKDGVIHSVNISIPKSRPNCILVGLRYVKNDNSYTEDHFLFEANMAIIPFYKARLEKLFTEYTGAHKEQLL